MTTRWASTPIRISLSLCNSLYMRSLRVIPWPLQFMFWCRCHRRWFIICYSRQFADEKIGLDEPREEQQGKEMTTLPKTPVMIRLKTVLVPSNTSSTSGIAFFVMVCDSIQKLGSISLHIWPFTRSRTGKKVDRSEVSNYVKHKGSGIRFQWPLMAIIKLERQVSFFSPFASLRILCTYRTSLSEPNHRSIGRGKDASVCWIGD